MPVSHQLVLVLIQPLVYHVEGPAGELPLHGPRRDVNGGLIPPGTSRGSAAGGGR